MTCVTEKYRKKTQRKESEEEVSSEKKRFKRLFPGKNSLIHISNALT